MTSSPRPSRSQDIIQSVHTGAGACCRDVPAAWHKRLLLQHIMLHLNISLQLAPTILEDLLNLQKQVQCLLAQRAAVPSWLPSSSSVPAASARPISVQPAAAKWVQPQVTQQIPPYSQALPPPPHQYVPELPRPSVAASAVPPAYAFPSQPTQHAQPQYAPPVYQPQQQQPAPTWMAASNIGQQPAQPITVQTVQQQYQQRPSASAIPSSQFTYPPTSMYAAGVVPPVRVASASSSSLAVSSVPYGGAAPVRAPAYPSTSPMASAAASIPMSRVPSTKIHSCLIICPEFGNSRLSDCASFAACHQHHVDISRAPQL